MINIILVLLLLHYLGLILFKPKQNILSCGIFGYAGKSPKSFNQAKFDILGIYNNSRGGDSCGVTTDGEIYYGLQASKNYYDFIVDKGYLKPKLVPVVFGHTRKSSVGIVNENNAHPFGFGEYGTGYEFCAVHNGTLTNHNDLAKEYDIETSIYTENEYGHKIFDRLKIDSEILNECIYKSGNIDVLNKYIGGAALIFQKLTEPNVVYAFHGASRKETGDTNPDKFEERPLYYYKEGKNSLYISSLWEPLVAIGGIIDKTIFEFDCNIVYRIEDGDIDNAIRFKVDRSEAAQRKTFNYTENNFNFHGYNKNRNMLADTFYVSKRNRKAERKLKKTLINPATINNIYDETDDRYFKSGINFKKLRYWRNGHLIKGIYTYIKDFGFLFLHETADKAIDKTYELMDSFFDLEKGQFIPQTDEADADYKSGNIFIPFSIRKAQEIPFFYFYDGVMVETLIDYEALLNNYKQFSFEDLSEMSRHPIIDITQKRRIDSDQNIIHNRQKYTKNHSFLQSGKIYNIQNGNLIDIEICENVSDLKADDTSVILLPEKNVIPLNTCNNINTDFKEQQNKELAKLGEMFKIGNLTKRESFIMLEDYENEDPEIIVEINKETQELINSQMLPIYISVQEANKVLSNMEKNNSVEEIVEINKDFLLNLNTIVIDNVNKN